MLKERVLTGAGLLLLAILIILRLPYFLFLILSLGLASVMAWEWSKLLNLETQQRYYYIGGLWLSLALGFIFWRSFIWLSGLFWILSPSLFFMKADKTILLKKMPVHLGLGIFLITSFWLALNLIQQFDRNFLVFIILLVVVFDTGCYGVGTLFGQHKLAPWISPNKTVEGLAGGVFLTLLMAVALPFLIPSMSYLQTAHGFLSALIATIFAGVGDFFESLIKRQFGVKDMGEILPGHGGVMDRLDSLLAVLPTVFCLLLFWEQYYRG